ncbi:toll/interleukin-1 receptor domain-containing protein [Polaribacter aquimarinus]|uniref:TIR domain-containing protein n=1 Tax=Polaribacter aquimarinus TaxID=2100726 RepID=A0A2U2J7U1_9FLAO|nr:toll/interleukin-1 receptor domain-containing protein [Polaribacter aquimarinus]PWG04405.1 hypothetical protein DIS07_13455 [Polaribacter aquimarinus]
MEKYLSQKQLDKLYRREKRVLGKEGIEEKLNKSKSLSNSNFQNGSIFFSHSHLDKTIVSKIGLLFDKLDIELYVDWLDKSLPESTNIITATKIKDKIKSSNKFLFLATFHGLKSKWCNWELGIADSLKSHENLAILPIETRSGNWKGNEYLELYSEMRIESNNIDDLNADQIFIKNISGDSISLREWISL